MRRRACSVLAALMAFTLAAAACQSASDADILRKEVAQAVDATLTALPRDIQEDADRVVADAVNATLTAVFRPTGAQTPGAPTTTAKVATVAPPEDALEIAYDDLARETERYVGSTVHFLGEVVQVIEGEGLDAVLRVNVTKSTYGWQDTVWVNYEGPRLLEDDIVEFWGVVRGRRSYTSIWGATITIPEIDAITLERVTATVTIDGGAPATAIAVAPDKGSAANPAAVGDVLSIAEISLCVLGWSEVDPGSRSSGPDEGYRWIFVDVLMVNRGHLPVEVSLSTSVRDGTGQSFDPNPSIMHSGSWWTEALNGRLDPNEQVRDRIGYEVPVDAKDFTFVCTSDLVAGKVFVALGEPGMRDVPEQMVGENSPGDVFMIGQAVSVGTLSVTVNDASTPQSQSRYGNPDPGFQYLLVDMTFVNEAQQDLHLSPDNQVWVKDHLSRKYMSDWSANSWLDTTSFEDTLSPGEKTRGQLAFQIAADAESLVLVFDPGPLAAGKVFFQLQ